MTVQRRYFDPVVMQGSYHRIPFAHNLHEGTGDGSLTAPGSLKVNSLCNPHRRWNDHARSFPDLFSARDAELIDPTVDPARLAHDLIDLLRVKSKVRTGSAGSRYS